MGARSQITKNKTSQKAMVIRSTLASEIITKRVIKRRVGYVSSDEDEEMMGARRQFKNMEMNARE